VSHRNIVVLGGSAGAGEAVLTLLKELPRDWAATIFIALHLSPASQEWLSGHFCRATGLQVESPEGEQPIHEGHIYVARPDRHLVVKEGRVIASRGPRENMWRPAVDVLFRTAAVAYGNRVIGVLMSGQLDDGTSGLQAIKACGGLAIVQDPDDTMFPAMPQTALANLDVDHRVRLDQMATLLVRLVQEPAGLFVAIPEVLRREALMADELQDTAALQDAGDPPTGLSCPECAGPLWRSGPDGEQFRCLVGHAYHLNSLMEGADAEIDRTLWAAIRLFEQRVNISRMMSDQERTQGREKSAQLYASRAGESHQHAQKLREFNAHRRTIAGETQA
jgi:two-component system chemotaxis response regulator CheB